MSIVLLGVLAVIGLFALPRPNPVEPQSSSGLQSDIQSSQVEFLERRANQDKFQPAILVFSKTNNTALTSEDQRNITAVIATLPQVFPGSVSKLIQSESAAVSYASSLVDVSNGESATAQSVEDIRTRIRDLPNGINADVTGGPAFTADLTKVFDGANTKLLVTTIIVVALLLIITYRSPVLWILPLAVVFAAEQVTGRLNEIFAPLVGLALDPSAIGITSVLVFGAGTDYALLLIARYKDQLKITQNRFEALYIAWKRTFEAIAASGITVILSLSILLLASIESTRAIGFTGAIGIMVALLFALIILPAILLLFGRWIFWPLIPRVDGKNHMSDSIWAKIGNWVSRRPAPILVVGVLMLIVSAIGALNITTGLSQNEQFRVKPEAVRGQEVLANVLPAGATEPLRILVRPQTLNEVKTRVSAIENVASVEQLDSIENYASLNVILMVAPRSEDSFNAVKSVRLELAEIAGADGLVGGRTAAAYDISLAADRDLKLIAPLILLLVFAGLVILLRAFVAPVVLILSVILTYGASLGLSWLIFNHVYNIPALDTGVLLLSFLFLVALGVDYNIFLTTRAREEAASRTTRQSMLVALHVTGGVITSAGILLAAVFAVLGVLPLITLTQIGVIVGIGVLLDTLFVRTILVPASAMVLGEKFWWPVRPK